MTQHSFQTVDDYIASQPEAAREALQRVRASIRTAVPTAHETISYNMPTYKIHDTAFLHFAAWKTHFSLYGASASVMDAFESDLGRYHSDKGTIRFPLEEPVPERLIERIAEYRAAEIAAQSKRQTRP